MATQLSFLGPKNPRPTMNELLGEGHITRRTVNDGSTKQSKCSTRVPHTSPPLPHTGKKGEDKGRALRLLKSRKRFRIETSHPCIPHPRVE